MRGYIMKLSLISIPVSGTYLEIQFGGSLNVEAKDGWQAYCRNGTFNRSPLRNSIARKI
jgi:hypothetical protein